MDSFNLNIDEYNENDIKLLLNLNDTYTFIDIENSKTILKDQLINNNDITFDKRNELIFFLDTITEKLSNILTNNDNNKVNDNLFSKYGQNFLINNKSNTNDNTNDNNMIVKKIFNIDSRFRENYYNTDPANFTINLDNIEKNISKILITDIKIPLTFNTISKKYNNNTLIIGIKSNTFFNNVLSSGLPAIKVNLIDGFYNYISSTDNSTQSQLNKLNNVVNIEYGILDNNNFIKKNIFETLDISYIDYTDLTNNSYIQDISLNGEIGIEPFNYTILSSSQSYFKDYSFNKIYTFASLDPNFSQEENPEETTIYFKFNNIPVNKKLRLYFAYNKINALLPKDKYGKELKLLEMILGEHNDYQYNITSSTNLYLTSRIDSELRYLDVDNNIYSITYTKTSSPVVFFSGEEQFLITDEPSIVTVKNSFHLSDVLSFNTELKSIIGEDCFTKNILSDKITIQSNNINFIKFNYLSDGTYESSRDPKLTLGWIFGFRKNEYILENDIINEYLDSSNTLFSITSEGISNLNTIEYIYVSVNDYQINNLQMISIPMINFNNYQDNKLVEKDILTKLTVQTQSSSIISPLVVFREGFIGERTYNNLVDIQKLSISLHDEFGRILDFNNMDWSCTLIFEKNYDII